MEAGNRAPPDNLFTHMLGAAWAQGTSISFRGPLTEGFLGYHTEDVGKKGTNLKGAIPMGTEALLSE